MTIKRHCSNHTLVPETQAFFVVACFLEPLGGTGDDDAASQGLVFLDFGPIEKGSFPAAGREMTGVLG